MMTASPSDAREILRRSGPHATPLRAVWAGGYAWGSVISSTRGTLRGKKRGIARGLCFVSRGRRDEWAVRAAVGFFDHYSGGAPHPPPRLAQGTSPPCLSCPFPWRGSTQPALRPFVGRPQRPARR